MNSFVNKTRTQYDLAACIVSYNNGSMVDGNIKNIVDTSGNLRILFILINSGSADNTKEEFEKVCQDKVVINYTYEEAYNNHYALAAAWNDAFMICKNYSVPYILLYNGNKMILTNDGIKILYNEYIKHPNTMSIFCSFGNNEDAPVDAGAIIHLDKHASGTVNCILDVNRFISKIGWWSECLMPYAGIDNDVNNKMVTIKLGRLMHCDVLCNYKVNTSIKSTMQIGAIPVIRKDGLDWHTIYVMMWGGSVNSERYKYPFNNPKFSHGVSYDLKPMTEDTIRNRVMAYEI